MLLQYKPLQTRPRCHRDGIFLERAHSPAPTQSPCTLAALTRLGTPNLLTRPWLPQMWDLLVWKGAHSQAPVAVAAKPHYFSELDLPATIHNLLQHCPDFWTSPEFEQPLHALPTFAADWVQQVQRLPCTSHKPFPKSGCHALRPHTVHLHGLPWSPGLASAMPEPAWCDSLLAIMHACALRLPVAMVVDLWQPGTLLSLSLCAVPQKLPDSIALRRGRTEQTGKPRSRTLTARLACSGACKGAGAQKITPA